MTSIIIGAPHENGGCTVHGVKNPGSMTALTPVKYVEYLRGIYSEHSHEMRHTTSNHFGYNAIDGDVKTFFDFFQDGEIASVKTILTRLSDMTKGRFYPNYVGMAFPVTEHEMREIAKCVTGSIHANMKQPKFVDFKIGEAYERYVSPEIRKHCVFIHKLYLRSKAMDHRHMDELYIMGVNISSTVAENPNVLVDDDVNIDPHILILHPTAVTFTRGVES